MEKKARKPRHKCEIIPFDPTLIRVSVKAYKGGHLLIKDTRSTAAWIWCNRDLSYFEKAAYKQLEENLYLISQKSVKLGMGLHEGKRRSARIK